MKALATIGTGPMRPVLDVALESFRPYAERHDYDVVVGSGESDGRPPSWAKVLLLRRLLESYDEVLWLDSDMVVVDGTTDVAALVPDGAFQALAWYREKEGAMTPNAGLWFVRSSPATEEFLEAVWECGDVPESGLWENLALFELLGYTTERPFRPVRPSRWTSGTHLLPDQWNYPMDHGRSASDARILHFLSMANEKRVRLMRLALLEASRPDRVGLVPKATWRLEWALRRAELSVYFRRRGMDDRRKYHQARFTNS
jgi:hypothetical protein